MDLARTPWVDRLFKAFVDRIARAAPDPKQMPLLLSSKPLRVEEFGCGHYGCALPTDDPAVVVKITTDPTEAAFAVIAMAQGEQPEGVVSYHAAFAVPGFQFKNRPAFVLWRQAAFHVGATGVFWAGRDPYEKEKLGVFAKDLTQYRGLASEVRAMVLKAKDRWSFLETVKHAEGAAEDMIESTYEAGRIQSLPNGPLRVAASLRALELIEDDLSQSHGSDLIGDALKHYRERGLLLADVHTGNVGHRAENDNPLSGIIIVDPGHAIALVKKWQAVEIPDLPE